MSMRPWQKADPGLCQQEISLLAQGYPALSVHEEGGKLIVEGSYGLRHEGEIVDSFDLRIVVPEGYPQSIPDVFVLGDRIPRIKARHLEPDGRACLSVRGEKRRYWPAGSNLCDFIVKLVHPFFVGQLYYETHGRWPWPERNHGVKGIVEWYREELGTSDSEVILDFMELLAKKQPASGHVRCPCGSGRRLRDCHKVEYLALRGKIAPEDADLDLQNCLDRPEETKDV